MTNIRRPRPRGKGIVARVHEPTQPDRILPALSGLTGTTITLSTKTAQRYEAVISSTATEGDTIGVTLKDVKEISKPGAPLTESLFIALTNIDTWQSGPADAKVPNGDSFRTDTDISKNKSVRERELQGRQPSGASASSPPPTVMRQEAICDQLTFGPGSSDNVSWDLNKQMFGVTTSFDEEVYTTKLDRTAAEYKERERKARRIAIASEILSGILNNCHIAKERNMNVDDIGMNKEDKYAVVRGQNAYISLGACKQQSAPAPLVASPQNVGILEVSTNDPDSPPVTEKDSTPQSPSPTPSTSSFNMPAADPLLALLAFRDFVTNEKKRLTQKKQALVKNEMEKLTADLRKFSQTFKLNQIIPDDSLYILAKDEEKQQQIREDASQYSAWASARAIGVTAVLSPSPSASRLASTSTKVTAARVKPAVAPTVSKAPAAGTSNSAAKPAAATKPAELCKKPAMVSMYIQAIPPFKGQSRSPTPSHPAVTLTVSKTPVAGASTSAAKPAADTKPSELGKKHALVSMYIPAIPLFKGQKRSPTPAVPTSPTTARLNDDTGATSSDTHAESSASLIHVPATNKSIPRQHETKDEKDRTVVYGGEDSDDDVILFKGQGRRRDASELPDVQAKSEGVLFRDLTKCITKIEDLPVARGGFGEIWECIYSTDQGPIKVAVKSLLIYAYDERGKAIEKKNKRIWREFRTCASLKHTNVLAVYGYTYGFGRFMGIVSAWAENGNLNTYLEQEDAALTLVRRFEILRDIAAGLQYLHDNNVIHGDLNGPNVLINGDGTACLADFGLSLLYSEVVSVSQASWTSTFQGNVRWMAPELFGGDPENELPVRPSTHSDIYSFGGIVLQVLTGKTPYYYHLSQPIVIQRISTGIKPERLRYREVPDKYWHFVEICWSDVETRPLAEEAVEWIGDEFDLLSSSSSTAT